MHALTAAGLRLTRAGRTILDADRLSVPAGQITAICGPNGSGKSSLLRCLAGLDKPQAGAVLLDGAPLGSLTRRAAAQRVATLLQGPPTPIGLTVADLAMMGRHPHRGALDRETATDRHLVAQALAATGLSALSGRMVETLSGGERQRAWIAMALAQDAGLLLLDEPTSFLDLRHQVELLALLQRLNQKTRLTIVAVLHDLNHVMMLADHVILLQGGRVLAQAPPAEALTEANLAQAFGLDIAVVGHPLSALPYCIPRWTGGPAC